MKILMLSWRGPGHPNAGGAETSTHEHAKGWVKSGVDVTLFTSFYTGAKKEEIVDGVKIIRRGRQVFGVHLEALKWYLFDSHDQFDLVIDEFHGIPFFTPLFVRRKKLGFIHEVAKEVWLLNPWSRPFNLIPALLGTIFEPLMFKLLYKNVPFMTVSESTRDDLIYWGIPRKNITVVHNGVSTLTFKVLPKKEEKKTLIFLGAISKDKGIEDALRIFSKVNEKEKDWNFWIVGKAEQEYGNYLKRLSKELEIDSSVKFWGYVSEKEKFELLARAHILINPSIREGWGLVVIEAASVGTPTAGYDVAGLRDSIIHGKTGLLCKQDIQSCTDAILSLISKNQLYENMVDNCKQWAKKFDWNKSSEESLRLIKKVVGGKVF